MRKPKIGQVYEYNGNKPENFYRFMKIMEGPPITYGFGDTIDANAFECHVEEPGESFPMYYSLLESYNVDELLNIYDKMVEEPSSRDEDTN